MADLTPTGREIVVGTDGSSASQEALRWAVRQAEQTGARVLAVMAWTVPLGLGGYPLVYTLDWRAEARAVLDDALAEMSAAAVQVTGRLVEGHAPRVLDELSEDAVLLVVGSHGHGVLRGTLLGSVSLHVLQHARCPVVVVPTAAAAP